MKAIESGYDVREVYMQGIGPRDLFDTICGEWLGYGISRSVYVYAMNPAYVVKFEVKAGNFQNAMEWDLWTNSHDRSREWLAPCREISPNGFILIQRRAETIPKNFRWPTKVPAWLTDYKSENYGLVDGRLVCFDYGTNDAQYHALRRHGPKMVSTKDIREKLLPYLR